MITVIGNRNKNARRNLHRKMTFAPVRMSATAFSNLKVASDRGRKPPLIKVVKQKKTEEVSHSISSVAEEDKEGEKNEVTGNTTVKKR